MTTIRMLSVLLLVAMGAGTAGCAAPPSLAGPPTPAAPQAAASRGAAVPYTLSFPEPGLDDPAAYDGYHTRLFRDAAGNTFQVYVRSNDGRVVNLWANAANESAGFTARDDDGTPATLVWGSDSAFVATDGGDRSVEYRLRAEGPRLVLGHFLLGSMRVERDAQALGAHTRPFAETFAPAELTDLVDAVGSLTPSDRGRHLRLLGASSLPELRARLRPTVRLLTRGDQRVAWVERPSLDGRNRLVLELAVPAGAAELRRAGAAVEVSAHGDGPVELTVRVTTDATALSPLDRHDIFNAEFFAFYDSVRADHERALAGGGDATDPRVLRFRRLERRVRGMELVSSREKLMAGLPNYATYFGRDMLTAALMMQPIWAPGMNEHVLGSVLRKLSPTGEVSHEEALGGQAIREHAAEYAEGIASWRERFAAGDSVGARRRLDEAETLLRRPQRVRENYAMVDDELQLPVLAARYISDPAVEPASKRAFLDGGRTPDGSTSRLGLLLRNLVLVAEMTAPYARDPVPANLIGFQRREDGRWRSASWRDSGAGYGGGRYPMDVNAIWVPQALESIASILAELQRLGYDQAALRRAAPSLAGSSLADYLADPASLRRAAATWRGSVRHFRVRLSPDEARTRIRARLASLPGEESRYWREVLERDGVPGEDLAFQALSLDSAGAPIAIMNTDIATRWFLDDIAGRLLADAGGVDPAVEELAHAFRTYPVGLLVEGLGPLVANDAYTTAEVWEAFERDTYHSPRVVWGREVNLMVLGLMKQLDAARDADGRPREPHLAAYVAALESALEQTVRAVDASGLATNEVWSYRIEDGRLQPVRWGASTDVQLWNLTSLVVDYRLRESS
jgi:hypothetical protein